jgi:hypothetical protein
MEGFPDQVMIQAVMTATPIYHMIALDHPK